MKNLVYFLITFLMISMSNRGESQITSNLQNQTKTDSLQEKLAKAQLLVKQGNAEDASKIYLSLMEDYPNSKEAVQGWIIANARHAQSGPEYIQNALDQFEKKYPENVAIIFWKAFIHASTGQNQLALENFNKLIKIQPDSAINYIGKGQTLSAMEKYKEAFDAFDRANLLDPRRPDVWGMKASVLARLGRFDEAITAVTKELELKPNNPVSIYNRACIYCLKGDKMNALSDLKKAINMNPSLRKRVIKDKDFISLYNDEDFKKLTLTNELQVSYSVQFNGKFRPDSIYIFIYPTTRTVDGQVLPEPVKTIRTSEFSSSFIIESGSYTLGVAAWGYTSLKEVINFPSDEKDLSMKFILNPVSIGYGKIKNLNEIKIVSVRGDFNNFQKEKEISMKKVDSVWKPTGNIGKNWQGRYIFSVNDQHTIDLMNKKVSPIRRWNTVFNVYDNNELVFDPSLYTLGFKKSEIETSWKMKLN